LTLFNFLTPSLGVIDSRMLFRKSQHREAVDLRKDSAFNHALT